MAPLPPPQGMNEHDYETIEAAVTETVRGRWFLGEFARRNRTTELRQLLDAMTRIETVVTAGQPALPPADPSIRLLMQRVKEIAGQLETLSSDMDAAGIDPRFREAVDHQARAVAGMMRGPGRGAVASRPEPPRVDAPSPARHALSSAYAEAAPPAWPQPSRPQAELAHGPAPRQSGIAADDPRLAVLSALDGLSLAKKLALFS